MENELLVMQDISKIYSNGFQANKNVNLKIYRSEIHALVGENGAGKTTLMKILFGLESHQSGKIILKGKEIKLDSPLDAIEHGIGMVHQHFMQVPSLTVAENVMLGIEPTRGLVFDKKSAIKKTQEISDKYQLKVKADDIVSELNVGLKQKVEILKSLARSCDLLILDEPTAVLTPQETKELFVQLKKMSADGLAIIFISHKLEEVMEICDRVTVLRAEKTVGSDVIANLDPVKISRMMVGRDVVLKLDKEEAKRQQMVTKIDNLVYFNESQKKVIDRISMPIYEGEVVGIAGVEGNGQNALSEILTGMRSFEIGDIFIKEKSIKSLNAKEIRDLGVGHISEDRMKYGCADSLSIRENIVATRLFDKEFRCGPFLRMKKLNRFVEECIDKYEVACDDQTEPIKYLSGGNIQKVIVAREFTSGANLIIANQPTRGIDVGTTEMIRKKLVEMTRKQKAAVLLISSDLNEVLEVSDRLYVMYKGKLVAHFKDAHTVNEDELGEYMLGLRKMTAEEMKFQA